MSIDKMAPGPIESPALIEMVHSLYNLVHANGVKLNNLSDSVASLKTKINDVGRIIKKVDHKVDDIMARLQNSNSGQGQIREQEHDDDAPAKANLLSSYSKLMVTGKEMPLLDIAFYWFRYNTRQLFLNEKSTVAIKKDGNRLRQHFSAIKCTMHVVIKNLNNYPDKIPSDPTKIVPWEISLKSEVDAALEKIKPHVKALNKNNVKALVTEYSDIDFPVGTPEEVKAFFNDKGRNQEGRRKRPPDESIASESNVNKRQRSM
jgi:hypothetical protein